MAVQGPHPTISAAAIAEMAAHALREYPKECCGLIFGPKESAAADEVRACVNIQDALHADDPQTHTRDARTAYNFGTGDLLKLQKSLRSDRPAKVVYHSHVEVGAYFSDTDQAAAQMDGEPAYPVEYVVVDVRADGAREAAQFAWDPDLRIYAEVARFPITFG